MENSQKIKRAALCLYAIAGVQAIALVYAIYLKAQLLQTPDIIIQAGMTHVSLLDFNTAFAVMLIIATIKCALELKKHNPWAWAGAVVIYLMAVGSLAIPAAVYGLLMVLQREVRNQYWPKLQTAIDSI